MTKTKRILTILLMAILSVMVALTFTACGVGDDNDDNGGSTANTKVTEAQFNASLTLTDTNFKFVMQGEEHSNEENETYTGSTTIIRSGDKVKCVYTDSDSPYATENYIEKVGEEYFVYAKFQVGGEWQKAPGSQNQFEASYAQAQPSRYLTGMSVTYDMLTYDASTKLYTYSMTEGNASGTIKVGFADGKIVSIYIRVSESGATGGYEEMNITYTYGGQSVTIPSVGGDDSGDSGVSPEPQDCQLIPTEFFDENGVFPKSYRCTCGDASHNVTNSCIKITSAEEFIALVSMLNHEANIGTLTIEIQNDIDLGGATIPALKAYDYQYRGRVFTLAGVDGGVTISNFTVVADQDYLAAGLFGCVTGDLTIKNITLSNMTINENEDVAAGAFVGIYMPAGDEETASGLRIENCSVVNSSITAGYVGGIYGLASSELSDERLIDVKGVKVQNCTLNGSVVGGLMGIGAQGPEKERISVSMNNYALLGNTITSSVDNQAGLYIGMFGNAKIVFEYSPIGNEDKINGNTVTANGVANDTRDYGRTGWTSEADATYVWVGQSPMTNFAQGVH